MKPLAVSERRQVSTPVRCPTKPTAGRGLPAITPRAPRKVRARMHLAQRIMPATPGGRSAPMRRD